MFMLLGKFRCKEFRRLWFSYHLDNFTCLTLQQSDHIISFPLHKVEASLCDHRLCLCYKESFDVKNLEDSGLVNTWIILHV